MSRSTTKSSSVGLVPKDQVTDRAPHQVNLGRLRLQSCLQRLGGGQRVEALEEAGGIRGHHSSHDRAQRVRMLATTMLAMPSPVPRRRLRRGLFLAAAVVLVVAGGVAAFVLLHAPGNVSNPNLQFTSPATTATTTTAPKKRPAVNNFQWPWYGYDAGRTRNFNAPARLHPPLHVGWRFDNGALLEFSPVI